MAKRKKREHRMLTPEEVRKSKVGALVIAPGIWIDRHQGVHFSIPDILQHLGLPDTPEDRLLATRAIDDMLAEVAPGTQVVLTDEGTDG